MRTFRSRDMAAQTALSEKGRLRGNGWWQTLPSNSLMDSATSSFVGTTITAAGSGNTKGSWTELINSTSIGCSVLTVLANASTGNATNTSMLLDIGIGAAASETVIIPNLQVGYAGNGLTKPCYNVPLFIPAGSRISARVQCATASRTVGVGVQLNRFVGWHARTPSTAFAIGDVTASSRGTLLTAPGALNTKAAWTELTSATTQPIRCVNVCVGPGSTGTVTQFSALVDIGVGGSGSEVVLIPDVDYFCTTNENSVYPYCCTFGVDIPVGTRIAARYARSAANGLDCHLVCS